MILICQITVVKSHSIGKIASERTLLEALLSFTTNVQVSLIFWLGAIYRVIQNFAPLQIEISRKATAK